MLELVLNIFTKSSGDVFLSSCEKHSCQNKCSPVHGREQKQLNGVLFKKALLVYRSLMNS